MVRGYAATGVLVCGLVSGLLVVAMTERSANEEMVSGYFDGFDPSSPEPSANRTRSYRHGFLVGRADRGHRPAFPTIQDAREAAEMAMQLDEADAIQC